MYTATLEELTEAVYAVSPGFRSLVNENTPLSERPDFDPTNFPTDAPQTEAQAAAFLYNSNPAFRAFVDSQNGVKTEAETAVEADPFALLKAANASAAPVMPGADLDALIEARAQEIAAERSGGPDVDPIFAEGVSEVTPS